MSEQPEQPRQKTAKELEKERKKAEKLAKFEAKKQKQAEEQAAQKGAAPKKKKEKAPAEPVPEFKDETKPGEKKVLVSLDDPALKAYNPNTVESSWYAWWKNEGFFVPKGDSKNRFVIPAPPPNVTGALHIGHALTISIQDSLIRFNRMRGNRTLFLPGFDHAGISTQSVVEKMMWNREGKTRHDYGREKFVDRVWEWKEEYHERIRNQLEKLGASYDWSREAFTLDDKLSTAVNEAFVRLFEDGTIYRASRLVNWCVALNTTLSNLEVDNKEITGRTLMSVPGYDEKVEFGVITSFAYPIEGSDEKLIVATTRPETMVGDTGIAIHPDDPRYKHLHGKCAIHPFLDRKLPIVCDPEAVDMEFGTGAVKITPAHDPNDYNTGKRHGLEFLNIMNDDGTYNENAGPFEGKKRFEVRKLVIDQLQEKGLFIEQKDNPMTIPLCNKSKDVIEPLLKPQWWVSQKTQAEMSINAVKEGKITIYPDYSESEFFHWMNNIQDWCISRQLWWGHRCPVYYVNLKDVPEDKKDRSDTEMWVAGRTRQEAEEKAAKKFAGKEYTLEQDEDVLDTWFSSGLWPFSTLGWPNDTQDMKDFFPMNLLETGWDILFFWVARMVMLGLKLTGEVPFTEVYCHSLIRDSQGRKMSKSLGNVIDPLDVIYGASLESLHEQVKNGNLAPSEVERAITGQKISFPTGIPQCGTDALRFALCSYSTGARDINMDTYRVEGYRKFCNKIYQATKFALMRLGEDYVPPAAAKATGNESLVEKWILHKLSVAADGCTKGLDKRDFTLATNSIHNFWLYEFCDVYIENSKYFFIEGTPEQQKSAKDTLYTCLDGALKLIHPFMPFLTEELWQRIPRRPNDETPSITVASYPAPEAYNQEAADAYSLLLEVVRGARSLFAQYNILKNGKLIVQTSSDQIYTTIEEQETSILSLIKAADKLEVSKETTPPSGAVVSTVSPECSIYVVVAGHVDFDAEIKKAEGKLQKSQKVREDLQKQVSKADYESKASEQVKENNQKRLEGYDAEIKGHEDVIKEFERLKLESQ